jgi:hypothetical protein
MRVVYSCIRRIASAASNAQKKKPRAGAADSWRKVVQSPGFVSGSICGPRSGERARYEALVLQLRLYRVTLK